VTQLKQIRGVFSSFYGNNSLFLLPFSGPVKKKKDFLVHSLLNAALDIGAERTSLSSFTISPFCPLNTLDIMLG
jgi:hypothetical protein